MILQIEVNPEFNKFIKTEERWILMLRDTIENEFGKADLDGELIKITKL
jgi:hypothetical protein